MLVYYLCKTQVGAAVTPGLQQTTELKAKAIKTNQKCKSGLSILLNYGGIKLG